MKLKRVERERSTTGSKTVNPTCDPVVQYNSMQHAYS